MIEQCKPGLMEWMKRKAVATGVFDPSKSAHHRELGVTKADSNGHFAYLCRRRRRDRRGFFGKQSKTKCVVSFDVSKDAPRFPFSSLRNSPIGKDHHHTSYLVHFKQRKKPPKVSRRCFQEGK